jgi:hypothetical protein
MCIKLYLFVSYVVVFLPVCFECMFILLCLCVFVCHCTYVRVCLLLCLCVCVYLYLSACVTYLAWTSE